MFRIISSIFLTILVGFVVYACVSGKSALKHGDYYSATLSATDRLRSNPDHKKSKEVLKASYSFAVDYLDTDVKNVLASNSNDKWRIAVQDYEKINRLYEEIRTSPGALKVIPRPYSRFNELNDAKKNAAVECYEAGIQEMMIESRQNAKNAYFLFKQASDFQPDYRESIEMMTQAKSNATVRVVVESASGQNRFGWNFEAAIFSSKDLFLEFYTPLQAYQDKSLKLHHTLQVNINNYNESKPSITESKKTHTDSVKVGEKTVNGKKVPVNELVSAIVTSYSKNQSSSGSIQLTITDISTSASIHQQNISGSYSWSGNWNTCTGDLRALSKSEKNGCSGRESGPLSGDLSNGTKLDLDKDLKAHITQFYNSY